MWINFIDDDKVLFFSFLYSQSNQLASLASAVCSSHSMFICQQHHRWHRHHLLMPLTYPVFIHRKRQRTTMTKTRFCVLFLLFFTLICHDPVLNVSGVCRMHIEWWKSSPVDSTYVLLGEGVLAPLKRDENRSCRAQTQNKNRNKTKRRQKRLEI